MAPAVGVSPASCAATVARCRQSAALPPSRGTPAGDHRSLLRRQRITMPSLPVIMMACHVRCSRAQQAARRRSHYTVCTDSLGTSCTGTTVPRVTSTVASSKRLYIPYVCHVMTLCGMVRMPLSLRVLSLCGMVRAETVVTASDVPAQWPRATSRPSHGVVAPPLAACYAYHDDATMILVGHGDCTQMSLHAHS